ncbi:glycosyltransferase family 61 protein [bacterium]|nr:MAG: glycosyltransferase family 61 protein [bacterium]
MQSTILGLPFRTFLQSEGIIQHKEMRPRQTHSFVFDDIHVNESGEITQQTKKSRFDIQAETFLFLDKNWVMVSPNGQFRFRNEYWALDSFSFPYPHEFEAHLPQENQPTRHLNGLVFAFSNVGFSNYYHVITELLPRLEFIKPLVGKVKLAVAEHSPSFVLDALHQLGFSGNSIIPIQNGISYTADTWLNIPWGLNFIPERFTFLKDSFQQEKAGTKRIYITRKNEKKRAILNEAELLPVLESFGFEVIEAENYSLKEQIDVFSQAEIICGPHGAGLSNLVWMKKPQLIEVRPSGFENECFKHVALANGAERIITIEAPVADSSLNMNIQPSHLKNVLDSIKW